MLLKIFWAKGHGRFLGPCRIVQVCKPLESTKSRQKQIYHVSPNNEYLSECVVKVLFVKYQLEKQRKINVEEKKTDKPVLYDSSLLLRNLLHPKKLEKSLSVNHCCYTPCISGLG